MYFNHIGDHIPVCQGVVDPIMPLGNTIADIRGKIPGALSSGVSNPFQCLVYKLVQMSASRMAVSKGALHHDLRFIQILNRPPHSNL